MTLRKPEDISLPKWIFGGWNLRTLLTAVILLVAAHYAQGTRITVVEERTSATKAKFEEYDHRFDLQKAAIDHLRDTKVEKDTYEGDQRRIAEELGSIQSSVGRIEQILMEQKR